jgi:hypothetical protein
LAGKLLSRLRNISPGQRIITWSWSDSDQAASNKACVCWHISVLHIDPRLKVHVRWALAQSGAPLNSDQVSKLCCLASQLNTDPFSYYDIFLIQFLFWLLQDGLTPLDLCLYSGQTTKTYELIKLLKQPPKRYRSRNERQMEQRNNTTFWRFGITNEE